MNDIQIIHGDCLEVMRGMASESIDAVVTDPPYGLSFMGKKWDYDVPTIEVWAECLRVLKPGGHLLAFAGTRTQHRMACRIEDAGFEIRDLIMWLYGSGFPKSHDVSKAMDKAAGVVREVVGTRSPNKSGVAGGVAPGSTGSHIWTGTLRDANGVTDAAKQWQGWGTALKPACEPITMARKPFKASVAANVLKHGTGAINVAGARVPAEPMPPNTGSGGMARHVENEARAVGLVTQPHDLGRWPANVIHDGSDEVLAAFPDVSTGVVSPYSSSHDPSATVASFSRGLSNGALRNFTQAASAGSAARFFYCAKADVADRNEGCDAINGRVTSDRRAIAADHAYQRGKSERKNHHPTVKPTDLMRYLVRLVTPPGGRALDPFGGSGSTAKACELEGFDCTLIEREADYVAIARRRIAADMPLFAAAMNLGAAAE